MASSPQSDRLEPRQEANDHGSVAEARRVLNDVYWAPVREITGDDFELLDEAINLGCDIAEALKGVIAWKDAVTVLAPELGGLLTAIYRAEAAIAKAEGR